MFLKLVLILAPLRSIPGVVETGLFSKPADVVFIASDNDVEILT